MYVYMHISSFIHPRDVGGFFCIIWKYIGNDSWSNYTMKWFFNDSNVHVVVLFWKRKWEAKKKAFNNMIIS